MSLITDKMSMEKSRLREMMPSHVCVRRVLIQIYLDTCGKEVDLRMNMTHLLEITITKILHAANSSAHYSLPTTSTG